MLWRIDVDKTHQLEREMWIQQTAALLVNHWHLARATIRACRLQGLFKVLCVFSLFTLIKYTHCKDWLKHVSKALICHFYMTAHEFLCSSFPAPDWMSLLEETFFLSHVQRWLLSKKGQLQNKAVFILQITLLVWALGWFPLFFFFLIEQKWEEIYQETVTVLIWDAYLSLLLCVLLEEWYTFWEIFRMTI